MITTTCTDDLRPIWLRAHILPCRVCRWLLLF